MNKSATWFERWQAKRIASRQNRRKIQLLKAMRVLANREERTKPQERSSYFESTMRQERAIAKERTIDEERAKLMESTKAAERVI